MGTSIICVHDSMTSVIHGENQMVDSFHGDVCLHLDYVLTKWAIVVDLGCIWFSFHWTSFYGCSMWLTARLRWSAVEIWTLNASATCLVSTPASKWPRAPWCSSGLKSWHCCWELLASAGINFRVCFCSDMTPEHCSPFQFYLLSLHLHHMKQCTYCFW